MPEPVHSVLSIGPVRLAVPVVSGFRAIGISPMNPAQSPATQVPVPDPVQHGRGAPTPVHAEFAQSPAVEHTRLLKSPLKHRWPPGPATAAGAGQSLETPSVFFDWHAAPWFGLPSHTPVHRGCQRAAAHRTADGNRADRARLRRVAR